MNKSWMNEYDTELGLYKYKGKQVICKTEEERKKYMKRIADESKAFEKYRKKLEGTPEAFRPGEDLEQHRKRLGY